MPRKRATSYKPEEIVTKLRQVDVLTSQGQRLKDLMAENTRLRGGVCLKQG